MEVSCPDAAPQRLEAGVLISEDYAETVFHEPATIIYRVLLKGHDGIL